MTRRIRDCVWRCRHCESAASTLAVLRRVKYPGVSTNLWRASANSVVGTRRCPACHAGMHVVECSGPECSVELDLCTVCQFVWFDPVEWAKLPDLERLSPEAEFLVGQLAIELERDRPNPRAASARIEMVQDLLDVLDYFFRS